MTIVVDAMGGDNAPEEIVKGAIKAAQDTGVEIKLTGRSEDILRCVEKQGYGNLPEGIKIVGASEVIGFDDDPASAIREKKDSSLVVGFELLRDGRGDALVSAGNTGAILTGATLIVKRVRGLRRAALAPVIPSTSGSFVLIDCGANTECTSEYLLQFAYMGSFYASNVMKINNPRIGLLNNGTENSKGTPLHLETNDLLRKTQLNYIGNIEAKDALKGGCDVLVTDGFTGNIMLKTIEGTASLVMNELKGIYSSGIISKLSYLLIKNKMSVLKEKLSADSTGGTALLGISKPVIKAHGSSGAVAVCNAIKRAALEAQSDVASILRDNIGAMKVNN